MGLRFLSLGIGFQEIFLALIDFSHQQFGLQNSIEGLGYVSLFFRFTWVWIYREFFASGPGGITDDRDIPRVLTMLLLFGLVIDLIGLLVRYGRAGEWAIGCQGLLLL